MLLTAGCDKDKLYCDPGYKYLGKYSTQLTCNSGCENGKITTWDSENEHCCCQE